MGHSVRIEPVSLKLGLTSGLMDTIFFFWDTRHRAVLRYINLASILSQSAFKSRLCLFCFCDFASSSHSLSCVASLLVVSLRHLQVEVCDFFFCLFVKGLDWLRDCVANGIIGIEWEFKLKLGIYIFFFVTKKIYK